MGMRYVPEKWDLVNFCGSFGVLIFEIVEGRAGLTFVELEENGNIYVTENYQRAQEPDFFASATLDDRKLTEPQAITLSNIKKLFA